jgi:hypothetical protein
MVICPPDDAAGVAISPCCAVRYLSKVAAFKYKGLDAKYIWLGLLFYFKRVT